MKRFPDPSEHDMSTRQDEHARDVNADESKLDQTLADSFPASDAPPWTLGVTRAVPQRRERQGGQ
jgi:hypothetical protein